MKVLTKMFFFAGVFSAIILTGSSLLKPGKTVQLIDHNQNEEPIKQIIKNIPVTTKAYDGPPFVTNIIDGDTIETNLGTVSLIGVKAPNTTDSLKPNECMSKEATDKTKELLEGKTIKLDKDVSETNNHGHLLRYVYLEDGTFINDLLIREGFARAVSRQPDQRYQNQFSAAEQSAKENKWGIWSDLCK